MEFTKDLQAWSSLEEEKSHSDHLEPWDGENHSDAISPNIDQDHVQETASEDSQDSADSGSDFGRKLFIYCIRGMRKTLPRAPEEANRKRCPLLDGLKRRGSFHTHPNR